MRNNSLFAKYSKDENFFNRPSIHNCYWGGFIAADGCIDEKGNRITFSQKTEDRALLENFKQSTKYTGKIFDITSGGKPASQLRIVSLNWIQDVKKHFNITPRKSLTLEPPNLHISDLQLAYIIGYIDGDGSIRLTQRGNKDYLILDIVGTYNLLDWIRNSLEFVLKNSSQKKIYKHGNCWRLMYTQDKAKKILKFLLNFQNTYDINTLDRKWDIARKAV